MNLIDFRDHSNCHRAWRVVYSLPTDPEYARAKGNWARTRKHAQQMVRVALAKGAVYVSVTHWGRGLSRKRKWVLEDGEVYLLRLQARWADGMTYILRETQRFGTVAALERL